MRIFCDHNIQSFVTALLRELGHDVVDAESVGLAEADDQEIAAFAAANDRFLLTHNSDFADMRKFAGHCAGIIRLRIHPQTAGVLLPIVRAAFDQLEQMDIDRKLITVTPHRVRIRRL